MNLWQFFCKNLSAPPQNGVKWAKQWTLDLQLIKRNFEAKLFWKNCFYVFHFWKKLKISSHFCIPGARFSPKTPPGSQTRSFTKVKDTQFILLPKNNFAFYLNFRKVAEINQKLWAKKGLFYQNGHFKGIFSNKSPQGGTRTGVLPGSAIMIWCSYQISSNFWKLQKNLMDG